MITRLLPVSWNLITTAAWAALFLKVSSSYQVQNDKHGILTSIKPRSFIAATVISTSLVFDIGYKHPQLATAATYQIARISTSKIKDRIDLTPTQQSPGWELARQKRTAAMKDMQNKGIIKINTDDSGNQYLKVPWVPDQILPYKSLSITQRLQGEVCAGAIGELSKDVLLHVVDTAKTRKQALKKSGTLPSESSNNTISIGGFLGNLKDSYAGFPVVLASSIPQGGVFFLVKKGTIELLNKFAPATPSVISAIFPIGLGVMAYWLFRTPAEVIKTQVQTYQSNSCQESLQTAKNSQNGLFGLWKYYPVMLSLDIPFQILNFVLFGFVSDAVLHAGYETSILTRLFCGVTCGMITGAVTCPIDVCKTRIISRDKKANSANIMNMSSVVTEIHHVEEEFIGTTNDDLKVEVNIEILKRNQLLTNSNSNDEASKSESLSNSIELYDIKKIQLKKGVNKKEIENENNWIKNQRNKEKNEDLSLEFQNKGQSQQFGTLLLAPMKKERLKYSEDDNNKSIQSEENDIKLNINLNMNVIPTSKTETEIEINAIPIENIILENSITSSNTVKTIEKKFFFQSNTKKDSDNNIIDEFFKITREEGFGTLFLGIEQRLLYVGLANGIRLAAYGTSRMDLMMKSLDDL